MTTAPPSRREALTEVALSLLESEGPEAVSTRKVAAAHGASTMVVYAEFGSLAGLVATVVERGFQMLAEAARQTESSADPVADLVRVADRYLAFAREHPHLFRVIYAVSPLGGYRRQGGELLQGAGAFAVMQEAVTRTYREGRLTIGRPYDTTMQLWLGLHGQALAELAGYLGEMRPTTEPLVDGLVRAISVAGGDSPKAARASIQSVRDAG